MSSARRSTSPPTTALDDDLGWMLGMAFRAYVKAADTAVSELPGGPRGYQVLTAAVRGEALNQGTIAERLGIDRTVLTYLIDDLERLQFVARRPDPADRRSRLVEATDEGRAVWKRCEERLQQVQAHVLGALEPTQAATFVALLQRVACAAQERDPAGDLCAAAEQVQPHAPASRRRRGGRASVVR